MVGHLVEHLAVGAREPGIVLEEIAMPIHMRDDQFLIGHRIAGQEIGVTRIGIDHHLIDFLQSVRIAFHQLVVLGPEPPMRIPQRKAAKRGQHAHLFVIDDFKNRLEEIEPVAPRPLFDLVLSGSQRRRKLADNGLNHGISRESKGLELTSGI